MDEKPAEAVRAKPDSSLVAACRAIPEGRADAVVSAGNTGAMLAAGLLEIRRLPGVMRPAIAVPIPARDGPSVLLDCGANADARPEHLLQFAHMGAIFAEEILGLPNPEVRLLSIGEEAEKGNQLTLEAHALLAESTLNFGGNTEGRDLLAKAADVVVTDGFTGQRRAEDARGDDPRRDRGPARGDHAHGARQARRPADPACDRAACAAGSTRHLRRRLPARPPRARRDRARQLLPRAIANAIRLAARGVEHDIMRPARRPVAGKAETPA